MTPRIKEVLDYCSKIMETFGLTHMAADLLENSNGKLRLIETSAICNETIFLWAVYADQITAHIFAFLFGLLPGAIFLEALIIVSLKL